MIPALRASIQPNFAERYRPVRAVDRAIPAQYDPRRIAVRCALFGTARGNLGKICAG